MSLGTCVEKSGATLTVVLLAQSAHNRASFQVRSCDAKLKIAARRATGRV